MQEEQIEQLAAHVTVLRKQLEQRSELVRTLYEFSSEQLAQLDGKPGLKAQFRLAEVVGWRVSGALATLLAYDASEEATIEAIVALKEGELDCSLHWLGGQTALATTLRRAVLADSAHIDGLVACLRAQRGRTAFALMPGRAHPWWGDWQMPRRANSRGGRPAVDSGA